MNLMDLDGVIREEEESCHVCFNHFLHTTSPTILQGYREMVESDRAKIKRYLDEWWGRMKGGAIKW